MGYRALPQRSSTALGEGERAIATTFDLEEHYEDFHAAADSDKVKAWMPRAARLRLSLHVLHRSDDRADRSGVVGCGCRVREVELGGFRRA
jgi:hypothetical protein